MRGIEINPMKFVPKYLQVCVFIYLEKIKLESKLNNKAMLNGATVRNVSQIIALTRPWRSNSAESQQVPIARLFLSELLTNTSAMRLCLPVLRGGPLCKNFSNFWSKKKKKKSKCVFPGAPFSDWEKTQPEWNGSEKLPSFSGGETTNSPESRFNFPDRFLESRIVTDLEVLREKPALFPFHAQRRRVSLTPAPNRKNLDGRINTNVNNRLTEF